VNYQVAVSTPIEKLQTVTTFSAFRPFPHPQYLARAAIVTPLTVPGCAGDSAECIATVRRSSSMNSINHYTIQRVIDVAANVEGRDPCSTAAEISRRSPRCRKNCPRHENLSARPERGDGDSFRMLGLGLVLAGHPGLCRLGVLFQSWLASFIIMMAVPGALIGIIWMLVVTGTTINVVSLMGAIMTIGIACPTRS